MRPEGWHIVIIVVIAIVLFGGPKLPGLARSVGQSLRIFKSEVRQMKEESDIGLDDPQFTTTAAQPAPAGAPGAAAPRNHESSAGLAEHGSPERQAELR